MTEIRIGKQFKLTKKLGSGAFGDIYLLINTKTISKLRCNWNV